MADAATRAQRAANLEEKRRRLEELKKSRKRRDEDTAKVKVLSANAANLDEYIDDLLKTAQPLPPTPSSSSLYSQNHNQNNDSNAISRSNSVEDGDKSQADDNKSTHTAASNVRADAVAPSSIPRTVEVFTIATQTKDNDFPESPEIELDEDQADEDNLQDKIVLENGVEAANGWKEEDIEPKVLSSQEIEKEISTKPFVSFIDTASKKVERMLGAELLSDLLVDYIGETDGSQQDNKDSDESRFLSSRQVFECPKWTATRDVTDLDWSTLHRELILSTYHMPNSATSNLYVSGSAAVAAISPNDTLSASLTPRSGELQSDGLALVWSLTMPSRPEHIFTCGSPVTAGRFHPTEPTLIIGGCESGQIVVWDVRAGRLPVQKSAFTTITGASSKGHVHPIATMEIVEGGLGMATSSTEGRINFWSLASLREPVESVQVGDSVSCFAVAPESEWLLLGDENGALFAVSSSSQSSGQRSSRKNVRKLDSTNAEGETFGHFGMVTAISTKTVKKGSSSQGAGLSKGFLRGMGGLVLTSGVDWTIKLWHPVYSESPLTSMVSHSYDYMSDIEWSPSHPSLFATASSNGTVGLWNLATSFEEPITGQEGLMIEPDAMSGRGLNKLAWSTDGRRMAVASADRIHVLSLTEEMARPKGDEEMKVMNLLMARGLISRQ